MTKTVDLIDGMVRTARDLRRVARYGSCSGRLNNSHEAVYLKRCTAVHPETMSVVIFTRDVGHHSSGWMKNPDYERCLHLSLSVAPDQFRSIATVADLDRQIERLWVQSFFGTDIRCLWFESAKSTQGKQLGVRHWRLFCDEGWNPILPRGEVYSTELTEMGWRSASQVLEEDGREVTSVIDPG